jgi:transposase
MENLDEHYAQLLGLGSPWEVIDVDLNLEGSKVCIRLEHPNGTPVVCPACGGDCVIADRAPKRRWRHLDTMGFSTTLEAAVPRALCPKCGVKTITVPWAAKSSRFTQMFEAFALIVIGACGCIEKAADLLGIGWDAVQSIMERGVERGLERRKLEKIDYVGIDEKSFKKGHSYVSLLNDLKGGRVLEVVKERTTQSTDDLWLTLDEPVRKQIKAVALDMWEPFIKSTWENASTALVVHDKFHIAAYLGKAVDQVRRSEHKTLMSAGDDTLKGSRQLWLFNPENLTDARWMEFEKLLKMDLKCAQAWSMKENLRHLWDYTYAGNAKKFFGRWLEWVRKSGEAPMKKVAEMLLRHLPEILNYFAHRITNAVSEGLNSKIQSIKLMARGFRGFKNYRVRILFFCGKLDMAPTSSIH